MANGADPDQMSHSTVPFYWVDTVCSEACPAEPGYILPLQTVDHLTLSILGKISAENISKYFFSCFSQKINFDNLCRLFFNNLQNNVCLFSGKSMKKNEFVVC